MDGTMYGVRMRNSQRPDGGRDRSDDRWLDESDRYLYAASCSWKITSGHSDTFKKKVSIDVSTGVPPSLSKSFHRPSWRCGAQIPLI
jgi:hypothetical protein